jgi:hypothetical protein
MFQMGDTTFGWRIELQNATRTTAQLCEIAVIKPRVAG